MTPTGGRRGSTFAPESKLGAGTTVTARFWDEDADRGCGYANLYDRVGKRENKFPTAIWSHHECDDGYAQAAPVGSFVANGFGVHDMLGNVEEWAEDCWNDSYKGAPRDGSAWWSSDCRVRVLRGGSWQDGPEIVEVFRLRDYARAASRQWLVAEYKSNSLGFRVARTLD